MRMATLLIPDFQQAFTNLYKQPLPTYVAHKIMNNMTTIETALQEYESSRLATLEKYCSRNADGKSISDEQGNAVVPPENNDLLVQDMTALLDKEVNLHSIHISELAIGKISAADLCALGPLITY